MDLREGLRRFEIPLDFFRSLPRSDASEKAVQLVLLLSCIALLAIGSLLKPDPRGFATHAQLGLPPCAFRALTGIPCPSCGMTTAFALAVRFDFGRALLTQPVGLLAFFGTIAGLFLLTTSLISGLSLRKLIDEGRFASRLGVLILLFIIVSWLYKIFSVWKGVG